MLFDVTPTMGLCELMRITHDYQQIFNATTDNAITHELWSEYENLLSAIWTILYQLLELSEGKS